MELQDMMVCIIKLLENLGIILQTMIHLLITNTLNSAQMNIPPAIYFACSAFVIMSSAVCFSNSQPIEMSNDHSSLPIILSFICFDYVKCTIFYALIHSMTIILRCKFVFSNFFFQTPRFHGDSSLMCRHATIKTIPSPYRSFSSLFSSCHSYKIIVL